MREMLGCITPPAGVVDECRFTTRDGRMGGGKGGMDGEPPMDETESPGLISPGAVYSRIWTFSLYRKEKVFHQIGNSGNIKYAQSPRQESRQSPWPHHTTDERREIDFVEIDF